MADFIIRPLNAPEVEANLKARGAELSVRLSAIVTKTSQGVWSDAKKGTPNATGALTRGWTRKKTGKWSAEVLNVTTSANGFPYGAQIENGFLLTRKMVVAMFASGAGEGFKRNTPKGQTFYGGPYPRHIPGRHMLANAVHTWTPIFRAQIQVAVRETCR